MAHESMHCHELHTDHHQIPSADFGLPPVTVGSLSQPHEQSLLSSDGCERQCKQLHSTLEILPDLMPKAVSILQKQRQCSGSDFERDSVHDTLIWSQIDLQLSSSHGLSAIVLNHRTGGLPFLESRDDGPCPRPLDVAILWKPLGTRLRLVMVGLVDGLEILTGVGGNREIQDCRRAVTAPGPT